MLPRSKRLGRPFRNWYGPAITRAYWARAGRKPMWYSLLRGEGIFAGISCGAAAEAASRLSNEEEFAGKTIVVILPDAGERYLSSAMFDHLEN